jgi:hypothetical protein
VKDENQGMIKHLLSISCPYFLVVAKTKNYGANCTMDVRKMLPTPFFLSNVQKPNASNSLEEDTSS